MEHDSKTTPRCLSRNADGIYKVNNWPDWVALPNFDSAREMAWEMLNKRLNADEKRQAIDLLGRYSNDELRKIHSDTNETMDWQSQFKHPLSESLIIWWLVEATQVVYWQELYNQAVNKVESAVRESSVDIKIAKEWLEKGAEQ